MEIATKSFNDISMFYFEIDIELNAILFKQNHSNIMYFKRLTIHKRCRGNFSLLVLISYPHRLTKFLAIVLKPMSH